jgi:flagellar protein FlgJ
MQTDPAIYTDFASLTRLKKGAREQSPEAIRQVARQFESLFVQMMLKSMRDTVPENEMFGSNAERTYRDMYDKQLSMNISEGKGIGLARVIERQLGGVPEPLQTPGTADRTMEDYRARARPSLKAGQSAVELGRLSAGGEFTGRVNPFAPASSASADNSDSADRRAEEFIRDVWPYAERAASALGVDTEVLLAQSALETGWGRHVPLKADGSSSHNLFGIKADQRWQGERVEIVTREFRHGVMQQEKAEFRAYDSLPEALNDYVDFIRGNPRYQKALQHGYDAEAYARELQQAGYATDPDYARKINRVRNSELLQSKLSELKNLSDSPLT